MISGIFYNIQLRLGGPLTGKIWVVWLKITGSFLYSHDFFFFNAGKNFRNLTTGEETKAQKD